jgi:hypothetical protein
MCVIPVKLVLTKVENGNPVLDPHLRGDDN